MKRLIATISTLALFFSQIGFVLATHYCGGEAVKTSLVYGKAAPGCAMASQGSDCTKRQAPETVFKKIPCCENQFELIQQPDGFTLKNPAQQKAFQNINLLPATSFHRVARAKANPLLFSRSKQPPAPSGRNIHTLIQSFLI